MARRRATGGGSVYYESDGDRWFRAFTLPTGARRKGIDRKRTEGRQRAGRLRRETGIRLPDALIAATALEHKLSLFTRNRSDFEKVRGLRIREIG